MTGEKLEHNKHCKIEAGACAQVHLNKEKTNGMDERTNGDIALGSNNPVQGRHKFVSVSTGKFLRGHSFAPFPMPIDVIKRADEIGKKQGAKAHLEFKNCCKEAIADDTDDEESDSDSDSDDDSSISSHSTAGVVDDETAGVELSDDESLSNDDGSIASSEHSSSSKISDVESIAFNESVASNESKDTVTSLHKKK